MSRPVTFNWEVARALRDYGWSYPKIARALGVHHCSVMYACDPYYRNRKRKQGLENARKRAVRKRVRRLLADRAARMCGKCFFNEPKVKSDG